MRTALRSARSECLGADEVFHALKQTFDASPFPGSPMPGVESLTEAQREAWQSLQLQVRPGTVADADVACLLAYFGADYGRNVRRVIRGVTLQGSRSDFLAGSKNSTRIIEVQLRVPGHAARLYHRWHDSALLEWLLAARKSQPLILQAENEAILSLWDDHWIEILRSCSGPSVGRIASALLYARPLVPEPLVWQAYLQHLRTAIHSGEAPLRDTGLAVLSRLRQSE